jgi:hypothetical protein
MIFKNGTFGNFEAGWANAWEKLVILLNFLE